MASIYEIETYEKSTTISLTLSVPRDQDYRFFVRASSLGETGKIYLKLGETISEIPVLCNASRYQWYEAGNFHLKAGENNLSLGIVGKVGISQILLFSLRDNESSTNLPELFASNSSVPNITYERLNPCTYRLNVEASKPFLLAFSESYNPLWTAHIEDKEITAIPLYSFLNGFFINKTGNFTITIYFEGQTYVDIGLKIASASFLFALAVVLTPSKVFRKIAHKIKPTEKE
jgi:hypothetical protein